MISQGDVFWADLGEPTASSPGYKRPVVVIQNDLFNQSRIQTVVVCALTSNLDRAKSPGNIVLPKKETGLPKDSVANVSQIFTLSKQDLLEKSGSVSRQRVRQLLEGISLLLEPSILP